MAASLGFPFTWAQWKELERQAMIYNYMMASVPLPLDLLFPITRNLSAESPSLFGSGSIFNPRFSSNKNTDEPGRCKRTDGKKWRCSKDVVPNQKYCERHLHRTRPRSRKPVEGNASITAATKKKTRLLHHPLPTTPTGHSSSQVLVSSIQPNQTPLLSADENIYASSYKEPTRGLDWMMEGELVTSEQQLQHLMRTNIGLTTEGSIYNTGGTFFGQEPLNLISHTDSVFLNHDLVSLEKEPQETPRGFIDAWSKDNRNDDDEMGQIQMGLGVTDSDHSYGTEKPQFSSWLGPAVSNWLLPSTPGGPLAEVLRPSTVDAGGLSSVSSYASNATMVSSPSGVLQRTMFSLSDSSSGCNSPTLATSTTMPSRQLN